MSYQNGSQNLNPGQYHNTNNRYESNPVPPHTTPISGMPVQPHQGWSWNSTDNQQNPITPTHEDPRHHLGNQIPQGQQSTGSPQNFTQYQNIFQPRASHINTGNLINQQLAYHQAGFTNHPANQSAYAAVRNDAGMNHHNYNLPEPNVTSQNITPRNSTPISNPNDRKHNMRGLPSNYPINQGHQQPLNQDSHQHFQQMNLGHSPVFHGMHHAHNINLNQGHPGVHQALRAGIVHSPIHQHPITGQGFSPFHVPGAHAFEPFQMFYKVECELPSSQVIDTPIEMQRFRHPAGQWDISARRQHLEQGDIIENQRKGIKSKEVKDSEAIGMIKINVENRKNSSKEKVKRAKPESRSKNFQATTSEFDSHEEGGRRINPRDYDTKYPDNIGHFYPQQLLSHNFHIPFPSHHHGSPVPFSQLPPLILSNPPNTPLHAQFVHQQQLAMQGHMPQLQLTGPFDSPVRHAHQAYEYQHDYRQRRFDQKKRLKDSRTSPSDTGSESGSDESDSDESMDEETIDIDRRNRDRAVRRNKIEDETD